MVRRSQHILRTAASISAKCFARLSRAGGPIQMDGVSSVGPPYIVTSK